MLYNAVLVSGIHQYESALGIHMSLPLEPPSHLPPHATPPGWHRAPDLISLCKFPLALYFTLGNVNVSVLLSQFIPPSPSPNPRRLTCEELLSLLREVMKHAPSCPWGVMPALGRQDTHKGNDQSHVALYSCMSAGQGVQTLKALRWEVVGCLREFVSEWGLITGEVGNSKEAVSRICPFLPLFPEYMHACSVTQLCLTLCNPLTAACKASLSMEFSR